MKINYFSFAHVLYLLIAAGLVAGLYFLFRRKGLRAQRVAVLSLVLINVIQHLFKLEIYPMYDGGFNSLCTAYNMCALLILLSPLAHLVKFAPLRDFVYYIGASAGLVALVVPYWNIGDDAFSGEFIRFFICHALLLASSLLPLLFGHHKASWRRCFFLGIAFFAGVGLIILNDVIAIKLGIYGGLSAENLYESLKIANPIWSFGPPESFSFVIRIVDVFTPDFLLGDKTGANLVPVFWYFIPFYLLISLVSFTVFAICDRRKFLLDFSSFKERIKTKFSKGNKA